MNDAMKNAEQYFDPTAGRAIIKTDKERREASPKARPGEIWKNVRGHEVLILGEHGWFYNCLVLTDDDRAPRCIISRKQKYTDPALVSYVKEFDIGEYVKTIPGSEFKAVLMDVARAFRMQEIIYTGSSGEMLQELDHMLGVMENTVEGMKEELAEKDDRIDQLQVLVAEYERRERLNGQERESAPPVRDGELTYKKLYEDMLDRLIRAREEAATIPYEDRTKKE